MSGTKCRDTEGCEYKVSVIRYFFRNLSLNLARSQISQASYVNLNTWRTSLCHELKHGKQLGFVLFYLNFVSLERLMCFECKLHNRVGFASIYRKSVFLAAFDVF